MVTTEERPRPGEVVEERGLQVQPQGGTIQRREFGGDELAVTGETAGTAAAARATAVVQARHVMALRRPRDWDDVRVKLMREVERPGFAEVAWYRKPVGEGVEGFSIRFAEAAIRCMGNMLPESSVLYDDAHKRIIEVTVTDLENNVCYPKQIVVDKTVERRFLKKGQTALRARVNSKGEPTYVVEATDDEVLAKEAALISKAMRTSALRILPGDIQDGCRRRILEIRQGAAAKDPDGERRKVADAFAELGVMPSALKEYLGHDLATASPAEIVQLRGVYTAIKTGESTWAEVVEEKLGAQEERKAEEAAPAKSKLDGLADKLEKAAAPAAPPAPAREPGADDGDEAPSSAAPAAAPAAEPDPRTPEGNPFLRGAENVRKKKGEPGA